MQFGLKAIAAFLLLFDRVTANERSYGRQPMVTLKNGSYVGKYVASYDQDQFLGVRYAQPPVGELRLQNPQSLNTTFKTRDATKYADSCVGYGNSPAWPFTLSEDCLTLNIVRPAGYEQAKLPVGVFIHGGGYVMDYSANAVYNLSWIVDQSVKMNKPIIGVSLDYRLSAWGFLASQDIIDAGVANLGLKDQRLALRFINENIEAFGGDRRKVVIWGESAGGGSVSYQATAYGGRDDGLFRGLIAESGVDCTTRVRGLKAPNAAYVNITQAVGCHKAADKLACLRTVPFDAFNSAIVNHTTGLYGPVVDGDFIQDNPSTLLDQGQFTKIPLLAGTNADEAALFTSTSIDSETAIIASLRDAGLKEDAVNTMLRLYPNIDALGLPTTFRTSSDPTVGSQYKRAVALGTDQIFVSWKRMRTAAWSRSGVPVYSYYFDSPLKSLPPTYGTAHFGEIGYVFYNTEGLGYAAGQSPFTDDSKAVLELANLVSRMWVSFIHDLDPNHHGVPGTKQWPRYHGAGGYGQNFHFRPNGSHPSPDTFRLAATTYIDSIIKQYGR